jgi:hypothetical protein
MLSTNGGKALLAFGLFLIIGPIIQQALLSYGYLPTASPGGATSDSGRAYIEGSRSGRSIGTYVSVVLGIAMAIRAFMPADIRKLNLPNGKTIAVVIAVLAFGSVAILMLSAIYGPVTSAR